MRSDEPIHINWIMQSAHECTWPPVCAPIVRWAAAIPTDSSKQRELLAPWSVEIVFGSPCLTWSTRPVARGESVAVGSLATFVPTIFSLAALSDRDTLKQEHPLALRNRAKHTDTHTPTRRTRRDTPTHTDTHWVSLLCPLSRPLGSLTSPPRYLGLGVRALFRGTPDTTRPLSRSLRGAWRRHPHASPPHASMGRLPAAGLPHSPPSTSAAPRSRRSSGRRGRRVRHGFARGSGALLSGRGLSRSTRTRTRTRTRMRRRTRARRDRYALPDDATSPQPVACRPRPPRAARTQARFARRGRGAAATDRPAPRRPARRPRGHAAWRSQQAACALISARPPARSPPSARAFALSVECGSVGWW